ncbi:MAG: hypothetical protein QXW97_02205 [Candidatus Pacearchaeota archaeon]
MVDVNEIKNRIINILKIKGPSLPVQISKELRLDTIITSAFLGELLNEKKIKTSNLRVGGTPLYFIAGEEQKLENFKNFLHPKEQEAYQLLKNSRILKDSEQEPAIRIALRNIKDFAFIFKYNEEIYWRYLTVTEDEIKDKFKPTEEKIEKEEKTESIKIEPEKIKTEILEKQKKQKIRRIIKKIEIKPLTEFANPLAIKSELKNEKIKPKSEFVLKVIQFLEKSKFKILEEKEFKKNEYNCVTEIDTELGPIAFLTQAKNKKTVSEKDLHSLLSKAQSIPLPALFITPGNLSKKAREYKDKYYSILKIKKI